MSIGEFLTEDEEGGSVLTSPLSPAQILRRYSRSGGDPPIRRPSSSGEGAFGMVFHDSC